MVARVARETKLRQPNYWSLILSGSNGWTDARRRRQARQIQRWQPWAKSTGPRTPQGKAKVGRNGHKGGTRQKVRDLAHELRKQAKNLAEWHDRIADAGTRRSGSG